MSDASCAPGARAGAGPPRGGAGVGSEAGAAEAVRVLVGLDEFVVTGAFERDDGVLEVMVRARREQAACPRCGTFSGRVKQRRTQRVRDLHSFPRPVVLVWDKRSFRCDTPGCVKTFTESTAQVPARKRLTERLRRGVAAAALDRSTAAVARSFRVGLAHRVGRGGRRGGREARGPPADAAPAPRRRRDDVPAAPPVHDRHRGPGNLQAVGHLRGPLQGRARRPAAPAR